MDLLLSQPARPATRDDIPNLISDSLQCLPELKHSLSLSGSFTGTFCLFMIMLSFGLFFSPSVHTGVNLRIPIVQQPLSFSVGSSDDTSSFGNSRSLLSHDEQLSPPILQPEISLETNSRHSYVRREISYHEVLLEEMNYTSIVSH